jgi:hypothetical protein
LNAFKFDNVRGPVSILLEARFDEIHMLVPISSTHLSNLVMVLLAFFVQDGDWE